MDASSSSQNEVLALRKELQQAHKTIEQLKEANKLYQLVVDHLPHYYVFWKNRNYQFLGGSNGFARKGGFHSIEDMVGKTDFDCSWEHQAKEFRNIDQMVVKQDIPQYQNIEFQVQEDGAEIWLNTTKCALHNKEGTVIGLVGVSEDITEKRRLEQMLKESETRFRKFSEAIVEGVAIHKNGVIQDANPIFAKLFNYEPHELIGMHVIDLNAPEFHETILENLKSESTIPFRSIGIKNVQETHESQSMTIDIEITLRHDPIEAISIRDITQQMRVERLKDEFLANTSHELRTPLNGIIGIAESLIEGAGGMLSKKVIENLGMIVSSGRRLSNLVNDILDYSKMRQESLDLQFRAVDLHSVVEVVLALSRPLVGDKPVELHNRIPINLTPVWGDENRLQQILYNLIGNAIKFTAEGEVALEVDEQADSVELTVLDTGIGIPNSQQKQIFQSFQQGDSSISREYGGTGLGLTISQQLVNLHGGTLEVANNPHRGSRFFFSLKKAETKDQTTVITDNPSTIQTFEYAHNFLGDSLDSPKLPKIPIPRGEGQSILVIDDEMVNLKVIQNFLELYHYRVLIAQSGFQALDILKVKQPDLILLDIMMPRMDGYELCEIIRQSYEAWLLPIIFLTAKNQVSDLIRGLQSGANDFLTKPFSQEELLSRVNTHVRLKESVETLRENQQLKTEIARRKKVELELDYSKKRLAKILDLSENAIMAINENQEIVYFNQQAERLFGYKTEAILGKSSHCLIAPDYWEQYNQTIQIIEQKARIEPNRKFQIDAIFQNQQNDSFTMGASVNLFELDDEHVFAFILSHSEKAAPVIPKGLSELPSGEIIEELLHKKQTIRSMEGFFDNILTYLIEGGNELIPQLRGESLQSELATESLPQEASEFREMLVTVMQHAVKAWEDVTHKRKFELAEESQLWKVYLDQGVFKTRTLDKYLKIEKLPQKPKWRKVIDTAEFVIEYCSPSNQVSMHRLQEHLTALYEWVGHPNNDKRKMEI